ARGWPRRRLRRLGLVGAALATLSAGAWAGHHWWTVGRYIETTDDAYVGGDVTAIAPHVSGFVAELLIADNERVHAGQVLVRLDPRDFQAALEHAAAVVTARTTELEGVRARYVLQQSAIRQQEADLAARAARATFTGQDAERYRSLAQTNVVSEQEAQKSATLDEEARSAVSSSAAGLKGARQQLKVLDAQVAAARAAEAEARSDLTTAQLNLGYTEIRSPIDGYVSHRAAQVGAYVAPGAYLVSVVPTTGLWVDANFKEDQLARIRPGQTAKVTAEILPNQPFPGRVLSLAHGTGAVFSVIPPENATGNFTKIVQRVPVRIALDAGHSGLEMLRPGLSITASVDTRSNRNAP
ncbi:MAG TPA: HlyD family secretion protein, partial [Candidatus Dormibacteraeota bacterium]|nr:HlyD family secretion protein [Candidatus Dormibacteraeota bacterium]